MNSTQKAPKKNGGSSSPKYEAAAAKKEAAAVPVPEKKGNGKHPLVVEPKPKNGGSAHTPEAPQPEKKRKGRAPTEGEPLRRVLIFLGTKEIDALKAQVGNHGMSTKIREILKEHLSK